MDKIYVLDSTVFLEGYANFFMDKACITIFEVSEELKNQQAAIELDKLVKGGLQIINPSDESIGKINEIQKKTNDKLSVTDIKLIALALDFKNKKRNVEVVSDDYAIQNICKILDMDFMPLSQKGIKQKFIWTRICKACKHKTNEEICETCGSKTIFVPKKY